MGEQVLPFLEAPGQLHQRLNSQTAVSQGENYSALSWWATEPGFWGLVVIIYSHFIGWRIAYVTITIISKDSANPCLF